MGKCVKWSREYGKYGLLGIFFLGSIAALAETPAPASGERVIVTRGGAVRQGDHQRQVLENHVTSPISRAEVLQEGEGLSQDEPRSNTVIIRQSGNSNRMEVEQSGERNLIDAEQEGTNNYYSRIQRGNDNRVRIKQNRHVVEDNLKRP